MEKSKPTCFVIQEFDDDTFDRRYEETIKPALIKSGVEPIRADKMLGLQPVIEKIEKAIREASICVAEVSTDNPNVWLELGYALAVNRPVVILCDKEKRKKLPFDIQHRPVILYSSDSKSGYEKLEEDIKRNVQNELERGKNSVSAPLIKSSSRKTEDFKDCEVAILTVLFSLGYESPYGAGFVMLKGELKSTDYDNHDISLGIAGLLKKELIQQDKMKDDDGDFFPTASHKRV